MSKFKETLNSIKGKLVPASIGVGSFMALAVPTFAADGDPVTLSSIVTSSMITGVFDQVYGILPVLLPAVIGFIALRKGWSFLKGEIYSA